MKCRRCAEPAVVDVRRHRAAFCPDCFVHHCREQVRRTVDRHDMIAPGESALVAVSGGKDSLMVWDVLLDLGYAAEGVYLGLGIGGYSDASRHKAEAYAARRGARLHVVDLPTEVGFDIPTAAAAVRRAPCGACGLSKRHLLNRAARELGADVLVTGHNLDDEAAVLFGNVLTWQVDYLSRQRPVLPATDGFVRRVKPLIRLAERETAAYCVLRRIDYILDECPMAAGNRHLRYKDALNELEEHSPGAKAAFYLQFLDRMLPLLDGVADDERAMVARCARCGSPSTSEVCAFCRLQERAAAVGTPARPGTRHTGPARPRHTGPARPRHTGPARPRHTGPVTAAQALGGVHVVELATVLAGPGIGKYLADFGADVVKVEPPGGDPNRRMGWRDADDPDAYFHKIINRGKRSVVLDLTADPDRHRLLALLGGADVLIENMRPGKLESLGLAPATLHARNPRLVVTRVTGFGQDGPYAQRPGFATLAEALSGYAAISGEPDRGPLLPPIALTDEVTALVGAFATLLALRHAERTGEGQVVDVNLLESMLQLMGPLPTAYAHLGYLQPRLGSGLPYSVPRGTYRCSDGRWVAVSATAESVARRVLRLVGAADDPRFATAPDRMAHREALDALVRGWIGARPSGEVISAFEAADAAIAPVQDMAAVVAHPQVRAREALVEVDGVLMQNVVARLSRTPGRIRTAGPPLGPVPTAAGRAAPRPAATVRDTEREQGGRR